MISVGRLVNGPEVASGSADWLSCTPFDTSSKTTSERFRRLRFAYILLDKIAKGREITSSLKEGNDDFIGGNESVSDI